jgi:hypothetical protein
MKRNASEKRRIKLQSTKSQIILEKGEMLCEKCHFYLKDTPCHIAEAELASVLLLCATSRYFLALQSHCLL